MCVPYCGVLVWLCLHTHRAVYLQSYPLCIRIKASSKARLAAMMTGCFCVNMPVAERLHFVTDYVSMLKDNFTGLHNATQFQKRLVVKLFLVCAFVYTFTAKPFLSDRNVASPEHVQHDVNFKREARSNNDFLPMRLYAYQCS